MSHIFNHTLSLCLIGSGLLMWSFAGRKLVTNPELHAPLNPFGINGSPYGEVFAMAMQGPIDTYFAMGMNGQGHRHSDDEKCDPPHGDSEETDKVKSNKPAPSLEKRLGGFLASLSELPEVRTNPKAASDALKLQLRRQAEDKLRFAYQLDPAHYGNYNSLHFFLTEPAVGTRPQLTPSAAKLAEDTIQYCLKQRNDPRPALTAAAAASNILQLMFEDQKNTVPNFNTQQMRQYLTVMDYSIARYEALAEEWDRSKNWELLSDQRLLECEERYKFISNIRDASEKTIIRYESLHHTQASN